MEEVEEKIRKEYERISQRLEEGRQHESEDVEFLIGLKLGLEWVLDQALKVEV